MRRPDWRTLGDFRKIGYARVSTEDQNLDMQLDALRKAGVRNDDLFYEKVSGVSKKRPALQDALTQCRWGDVLVVWRLDRVARSLQQLLTILQGLEDRGVGFLSLTETLDTTTPAGRLYLQLAGAFAEFERQVTVQRTRAGVKRAQERGVKFGAKLKIDKVLAERLIGEGRSVAEVATACNVAKQTVRNHYPLHERELLRKLALRKSKARKRRK